MITTDPAAEPANLPADPRRWWVLALLSGPQFMILLDMTTVNVALPRSRRRSASPIPGSPGW